MTLIRPAAAALLSRYSEVIWACLPLGFGLWLIALGGYLLTPLGTVIAAVGVSWGILALRRMRFAQTVDAPGVVEIDEGQIGYLGPQIGGYVSLPELIEIRLITMRGRRLWRLKQADGQTILIPVDAAGADALFDAFTSLPGMDSSGLVAALQTQTDANGQTLPARSDTPEMRLIWRRQTARAIAR